MKRMMMMIGLSLVGLTMPGYAGAVDILKPEYQRQERELQRIMEQLASKGLEYQVVTEPLVRTNKMGKKYIVNVQTVRIPKDLKEKIVRYDQRFARWNFAMYLDDSRYSFYAAVLILGRGTATDIPQSIVKHDKELWWSQDLPSKKSLFLALSILCNFQRGRSEFVPSEGYYGSILYESIPHYYNKHIFAERIYETDRFATVHEPNPIMPYGHLYGRVSETGKLYERHFESFLKDGNKVTLRGIALVQPCVEHWLYLTLFGDNEKQLLALEGMLAWSRMNTPVENPFLSALAMGLFTINGYAFNDETGVYTMNERGKMLMDFIVEFPIPENATRLQAVMNGGNKEEIEGMMKKHGTTEKWAELLKNPVHPEFAKYPQD